MTPVDHDDGEPDDPKLRQMRAVWISMRDEDPPARGLDELLAAARSHASTMRPAPWWQRALGVLRRPPVLAFATVTILIGGVVLVRSRHDDIAEPRREIATGGDKAEHTKELDDRVAQGPRIAPPRTEAPGGAESAVGGEAGSANLVAPAVPSAVPVVRSNQIAPQVTNHRKPSASATRDHEATIKLPPAPVAQPRPAELAPTTTAAVKLEAQLATDDSAPAGEPVQGTGAAVDRVRTDGAKNAAKQKASSGAYADEKTDDDGGATDSTGTTRSASVEELLKECTAAATRGDCAAARALAVRIAKTDAAFYRARVVKDAAVAKCLSAK